MSLSAVAAILPGLWLNTFFIHRRFQLEIRTTPRYATSDLEGQHQLWAG